MDWSGELLSLFPFMKTLNSVQVTLRSILKIIKNHANLASCGIYTICTTHARFGLDPHPFIQTHADGSTALAYEIDAMRRLIFCSSTENAVQIILSTNWSGSTVFWTDGRKGIAELTQSVIAGLPGAEEGYTMEQFNNRIAAMALYQRRFTAALIQFLLQ